MTPFNGHRSWNAWNVSLWIANDEPLYRRAYELGRKLKPMAAARVLRSELPAKTPDGAAYTQLSVALAIKGLVENY